MVSFWLSLLISPRFPTFASEAIDQTKNQYYRSLRNSRNCHNDMTYFLLYLLSVSISYFNCYKNIEILEQRLKDNGIVLTETERAYVTKILISANGSFVFGDFLRWTKSSMSKQAAFKILNAFESYGILKSREGKSKNKIFAVNPDVVVYRMKDD